MNSVYQVQYVANGSLQNLKLTFFQLQSNKGGWQDIFPLLQESQLNKEI